MHKSGMPAQDDKRKGMKFGEYECISIDLGNFYTDGGAMFGVVPKTLWKKKIPPDKMNRIPMRAVSLLIKGKRRNILVDTGYGSKLSEKLNKIYGITSCPDIDVSLSRHGLTINDVTDVFITHLHFDHIGGATHIKNNQPVPSFPNAVYYIQKKQWEAAIHPNIRDKSSYIDDNYLPLKKNGLLKLTDGPEKLFPGIETIVTQGHTPGQQHILIKGDPIKNEESLFFCADLIPTSAHIPIAWNMAYDLDPLTIMEEKAHFLKRAIKENWILFFEHDTYITAARITEKNKKITLSEKVTI
ncbi:MAG: MBL fold metallo-hydrolase [Deltaproteobacteria bacterium]|nr:MBL fold metallo-hydrolase [Deltaproteobacteria bacterium]